MNAIDFQDGFAASDLVDLGADPHLGHKGIGRFNSGAAGLPPTLELIVDDTTNGGGDHPDMTTFIQVDVRFGLEGYRLVPSGTPVSSGNLQAAGAITSQASGCPNLVIAGVGGAVVVDACDGSVVKKLRRQPSRSRVFRGAGVAYTDGRDRIAGVVHGRRKLVPGQHRS